MIPIELLLLIGASLVLICILLFKFFDNFGIPILLLFLGIGMLAGSEGPGRLYFDDPRLAQAIGIIALVLILFAGGLDTKWSTVRPVVRTATTLSTLGVILTAFITGIVAVLILGLSIKTGFLLGAIISSTDAAAVFAILRSRHIGLKPPLRPLLELESGSNDPMAIFLTVVLIQLILVPQTGAVSIIVFFLLQMSVGAAVGVIVGRLVVFTLNRLRFFYGGLYPVFCLAAVAFTYALATLTQGNGFLAVYIAGIIIGNSYIVQKRSLLRFFDGFAWFGQITMFLCLGLLVYPSRLVPIIIPGLLISVILMFVARPLSVFISLVFSGFKWREKLLVSWVGLRGAVPIILATYPLLAGIAQAELIFNIIFFIVISSAIMQGWSLPLVARWLKVAVPPETKRNYPIEFEPRPGIDTDLTEVIVPFESAAIGKSIVELGFPEDSLIVLIVRGENYIVPSGGTVLESGDVLLILAGTGGMQKVTDILSRQMPGAVE